MSETHQFSWGRPGQDISSSELMRECGRRLTDRRLWAQFEERFQRLIFMYLLRAVRRDDASEEARVTAADLTQDVYLRLIQNDGRVLRSYKGESEFSVRAFLSRVCVNVAADHHRRRNANKRQIAQIIPIDRGRFKDELDGEKVELDVNSILSWIDVQRLVESESDGRNATRNVLIFKQHYVDGFTAAEIACFSGYDLSESGVNTILARLKARLKSRIRR